MMKIRQLLLLLIISTYLYSQPDTLWSHKYGGDELEIGNCVQQTTDGGFIISGKIGDYFSDGVLIKVNELGNLEWIKNYGGTSNDIFSSIKLCTNNQLIISGETASFGLGWSNGWILKINLNGDTLWTKTYGGEKGNNFKDIVINPDGGFTLIGSTNSFGFGESDFWVIRIDSTGGIIWERTFGGEKSDYGISIQRTFDDGFILCGNTNNLYESYYVDILVIKINNSGEIIWQYQVNGSGFDACNSIIQCQDGSYAVVGHTEEFVGEYSDLWIIKIDSLGNYLWDRKYGGDYTDYGESIQETYDSGFVATGTYNNKLWIIKTDSIGNLIWEKIYDNAEHGKDIQILSNYEYILLANELDGIVLFYLSDTNSINSIMNNVGLIESYSLEQNYPNPFNPTTTIPFQLPKSSFVKLTIYDITGRLIKNLINEYKNAGYYSVNWDTDNVVSGIYFYKIDAGEFTSIKRCLVIK